MTVFDMKQSKPTSQLTRDVDTMMPQCWATVCHAGRTSSQHLPNFSCLLESHLFNCYIKIHFHPLEAVSRYRAGGGPGVVVKAAWKIGDRGFEPHSDLQIEKKSFFPAHS